MSTATLAAAPTRFMTEAEVAHVTGLSIQTLRNWRCTRRAGPPFVKLSQKWVRYERAAVEAWIAAQTVTPNDGAE